MDSIVLKLENHTAEEVPSNIDRNENRAKLRQVAENQMSVLRVKNIEVWLTWLILILILSIDVSFAYEVFRPLYMNEYGEQSIFDAILTFFKASLPLVFTIGLKLPLRELEKIAIGQDWRKPNTNPPLAIKAAQSLRWLTMVAGAALSLFVLAKFGQVTFERAAKQMAELESVDVVIGIFGHNALASVADSIGPSLSIAGLWPVFIVTTLAGALTLTQLDNIADRRKGYAHWAEQLKICDEAEAIIVRQGELAEVLTYLGTKETADHVVSGAQLDLKNSWFDGIEHLQEIVWPDPTKEENLAASTAGEVRERIRPPPHITDREGYIERIRDSIPAVEALVFYQMDLMALLPAEMLDANRRLKI